MSTPNALVLTVEDGTEMHAYTALPPNPTGAVPGILLLQEAFGVNAHIRSVADRLARAGYAVVAPELFHRSAAPGQEFSYADFPSVMPHFQALTTAGMTADVRAASAWLRAQEGVVADKMGSLGFCLGGRVSFLANAVLPLRAGVSYYGGGLGGLQDRAADLHAPHLFFWGGQDQHIPKTEVAEVTAALDAAGKPYVSTVISSADHGFNCDARPSYNPAAAHEAWALTLAFFQEKFK